MTHAELVEKVARAIWGDDYNTMKLEALAYAREPNGASAYREVLEMRRTAQAAIAAIREALMEPTEAMIRDGVSYRLSTSIGGDNHWPEDTKALFRAMLAASPLGEKP